MSYTQADIDAIDTEILALKDKLATSVRLGDKSVTYDSLEARIKGLERIRNIAIREVNRATAKARGHSTRNSFAYFGDR